MSDTLKRFLEKQLESLKSQGLYNTIEALDAQNGPVITIEGKSFINLSSNNYLGLAAHPEMIKASNQATEFYGVGAGAVRTINGTMKIHHELEKALAAFKHTEAAIAFQSGFNANIGTIPAIMDKQDAILSDALNHASIIDGCRLSGAKIIPYQHNDMESLESVAKEVTSSGQYKKVMVITDGVFSMDGDLCKLPEIVEIAKRYDLITYVDDAHGSGVMGKGAGTVKHFGLSNEVDIQMGTLSKAVGVVGGYVAGKQALIDYLKVRARPFLFSTALTPGNAAACLKAIELMEHSEDLITSLWDKAAYLRSKLQALGFDTGFSETPITPVIIGDEKLTQQFSRRLYEEGVYAKAIVFPTVALGKGRIRNMPSAAHSLKELDQALEIYAKVGKELGVIA